MEKLCTLSTHSYKQLVAFSLILFIKLGGLKNESVRHKPLYNLYSDTETCKLKATLISALGSRLYFKKKRSEVGFDGVRSKTAATVDPAQ